MKQFAPLPTAQKHVTVWFHWDVLLYCRKLLQNSA